MEKCNLCKQYGEYNGWSNRETWVVFLWLTNEEWIYNEVKDLNATELKAFFQNLVDELLVNLDSDGMIRDLLSEYRINWEEIEEGLRT